MGMENLTPAPNKRSKTQYFAFTQGNAGWVERGMLVLRLREAYRFLIVPGGKVERIADQMQDAGFNRAAADGGYYLGEAPEPTPKECPILFIFFLRTRRQLCVK